MKTKKITLSPPGTSGQRRRHRFPTRKAMTLWLFSLLMLFGFSFHTQEAKAKISFGSYSYISKQPTLANPSIELTLAFYSRWDSDSYFTHDGGGPKLYIDNEYIGSLDSQLAWPGGNGNSSGLDNQRGVDGWWYIEHDIDHAKYKVKCWDPRYDDTKGCFFCTVVIFPKQYKLGVDHKVSIRGYWKTNNENNGVWVQPSWTINAIDDTSLAATSATMTDYNHFNLSGTLNSSYGPTWVLTSTNADGSSYIDPGTQSSYGQGTASFSNKSLEIDRNDYFNTETKPVEYVVKRSISQKGQTVTGYLYKWFNVDVPGFVKATGTRSVSELWKKNIKLTWSSDDSGGRSKEGKWRVKRRLVGGSSWTTVTSTDLTYNDNPSYTDTDADLAYNTKYEYKIVFIPKNISGDGEREELSQTLTNVEIVPSFEFSNLSPTPMSNSVLLSWSHPDPTNGEQLTFKVWRTLNRQSLKTNGLIDKDKVIAALGSEPLKTVPAAQGTTSCEDNNLANNMTLYLYIISVEAFGETWYSDVIGPTTLSGHTEILNVTANRGTYSNVVKVQWDVKHVGVDGTRYVVSRRLLGSDEDFLQVHMVTGTESSYYFSDNTAQPGQFYQYRVVAQGKFQDPDTGEINYEDMSSGDADGFCQSRGTISGRITYGTGTAVADARVQLTKNNENGDNIQQFYSMYVEPMGGIKWMPTESTGSALFVGKAFTFQMYVRPETVITSGSMLIDGGTFALILKPSATVGESELFLQVGSGEAEATGILLKDNVFTNLSVSNNGSTGWTFRTIDADGNLTTQTKTAAAVTWIGNTYFTQEEINAAGERDAAYGKKTTDVKIPAMSFGGDRTFTAEHSFTGYLDDIRLWSKELTDDELLGNYDRLLIGTEAGLKIYWPMDEGVNGLPFAYDYSKTSGVANENHGRRHSNTSFVPEVPDKKQLRLYGKTDSEGNYVIRGVPFSGEGTSYKISPALGVHEFSPKHQTRFVNMDALTHNGVDFEDVSAFDVDGVVYYDGTTIPVKDVLIYVDGNLASKDGEAIKTNAQGKFVVSVPIGDHFIQVKKNGHTFVEDGRYPYDPNGVGTRFTFESEVSNLGFYDNTRVTVAGRIAGGDIETEKLLGLGLSTANIGQARMTLSYANSELTSINVKKTTIGNAVTYNDSDEQRDFEASTPRVNSSAYVAVGDNFVTIETDPVTGEWAAELLPLRYTVESIVIPHAEADYIFNNLPVIDATNPTVKMTDSLNVDSVFKYIASAKIEYKSQSVIELTEHLDGSFGEQIITVKGLDGNEADVPMYVQNDQGQAVPDGNGNVQYYYSITDDTPNGCPVYKEMGWYTYKLHAFEQYINKDSGKDVIDKVPMAGKTVKISNDYATGVAVSTADGSIVESNEKEFELDADGRLTYKFQAGIPNFVAPYQRGITITLDDNDTMVPWEGNGTFRAVVLGSSSDGTNFTTQAPDEVIMVLRDPPGSNSYATFTKGHTFSEEGTLKVLCDIAGETVSTVTTAAKLATVNGMGVAVITETNTQEVVGLGLEMINSVGTNNSWVHSTTSTMDISTSDDPDFVGAPADRFYGVSKNRLHGKCHMVKIKKNEVTGEYILTTEDGISVGEEFGTIFFYTQNQIENRLIPEYEELRDSLLQVVANLSNVAHPAVGEDPIYVTTWSKDDEKFGTNNHDTKVWGTNAVPLNQGCDDDGILRGPSYWMILPADWKTNGKQYQDMVLFYNEQVKGWKQQLANNERAKLEAIQESGDYLIDNYSIDGGGSLTYTTTTTDTDAHSFEFTEETKIIGSNAFSTEFNGNGTSFVYTGTIHQAAETTYVNTDEFTSGFSFTLAENGDDDYLSIDVYDAPDKYGPIFVTKGGATSCPYEDAVVTKYYRPGTEISPRTVQIEKPEIEARVSDVTGIPAGGVGTFQVYIRNNSETREDGMYNLNVVPASNPDGLVVKMDGLNITTGRAIMVKAGETMTKTFTVEQSNPDVLTYEDIKIRISSQCQPDNTGIYPEIADTTVVSFYFQPACSDIQLASSHSVVNTDTKTVQTLSITGYNYTMTSLTGVRLEYKGENDADFHTLQEYVKDEDLLAADPNLLELPALKGTEKLNYVIDLRDLDGDKGFTDKTYVFRAVTVCMQGGVEVNNESDEVRIIRDMTPPQLIATPSPASGILGNGDDLVITFNEDIQGGILSEPNNFDVVGILNESPVAHDVALSLTGSSPAKTDATLNLSGKSFSASMWVNYSSDGTLLSHGTADNNFTVAIENGKLAVTVAGDKHISENSLPANKWLYLNVSYEASMSDGSAIGTICADYAQDASTVTLLNPTSTNGYEGNGVVSVGGNNLTAKVQELALWNSARSMSDAQAEMYTTKSQYTNGLIGYWQLNEGHGEVAIDKARSRNMTLPSKNAWWINGANFALTLDGTKAATVNIGALNTISGEDYLLETWFKADEQQNGVASILATQKMDLRLNAQGKMELETGGTTYAVSSNDLRDGQWHHVAVNVLKSTNGSGIIFIDGQQVKQVAASAMPLLFGDKLMLGSHRIEGTTHYDQMLKGAIDEVRVWKGRRTADVIKNNMYLRVKTDEAGLEAYYPMETNDVDLVTNQVTATGSLGDAVTAEGNSPQSLTFYNSIGESLDAPLSTLHSENTAALQQAPAMDNVRFSFVASERQIKVNLNELAPKIEGCYIYITAKKVKDLNGNQCEPITWSVYVQQNTLCWQEPETEVTVVSGAAADERTFSATIENRGSQTEVWSLSGMPEWLSANVEGGSLMPQASTNLTFTVSDGLPIGTYETTVYLTGSQDIKTPLNIIVTNEGEAPDWVATPGESTMTLVGVLNIDGVQSSDPKDMVAAFRGTECVGVAQPKYFSRYDAYMVLMNIYGSTEGALTYKAYDASTGTVYPSVSVSNESAKTFVADKSVGTFTNPVEFLTLNEIEQDLSHNRASWKWFSLYAQPKVNSPAEVFKDALGAIDIITSGEKTYIPAGDLGDLKKFDFTKAYKLQANAPYVETVIGAPTDPTDAAMAITLKPNWTWIGYPCQASNSLNAAFTSADPQEGDVVKGQSSFALYTEGEWIGTLNAMQPGEGYMYMSNAGAEKTFNFTKPSMSGHQKAPRRAYEGFESDYCDNMTMIAVVKNGEELVEEAQVSVYAGTELRGLSTAPVADGRHFLTIGGTGGVADMLTFVVTIDGQEYYLMQTETFQADALKGTMEQPYVLQTSEATGLSMPLATNLKTIRIYDTNGLLVRSEEHPTRLFTKDDLKSLADGIYYQQVTLQNGQSYVLKMMR